MCYEEEVVVSPIKLIGDLIWELNIYHLAVGDCPRKQKMYCRICYVTEKGNKFIEDFKNEHQQDDSGREHEHT